MQTIVHRAFCKFKRTTNYSWPETNVSVQHSGRSPGLKFVVYQPAHPPSSQERISFFPVTYRLLLPNYGDEFVQDFHLFPFSPKPMLIFRIVLTPVCYLFNCSKYIILFLNVKCEGTILKQRMPRSARHPSVNKKSVNSIEFTLFSYIIIFIFMPLLCQVLSH